MALQDDVAALQAAVAAVDLTPVTSAVETVVADVAALDTPAPTTGDNLLDDVVAFLTNAGYTVTSPNAPEVETPAEDATETTEEAAV